jgi:truncated hemoglobin YjbI
MLRRALTCAAFCIVVLPITVRAQDANTAQQDYRIRLSVVQVITVGAEVYNSGDHAGCYRIYQGAITGLLPQLDYRQDLQKAAKAGMDAATQRSMAERAFALRAVLDKILGEVTPKLWDRLGGEQAVKAVVHDFVALLAQNPKVDVTRGGKFKLEPESVAKLEKLLVEQISSKTGGPLQYTGRDMKIVHGGMMITEEQFGAGAADLIEVLKKYKVPQQEMNELVGIIANTKKDIVMAPPSLYTRLGGEAAVTAVIDDFVGRAAGNPAVNFTRKGTPAEWNATPENVAQLKKALIDLVGQLTGGPQKYAGRDMKAVHKGMMITDAEFNALAGDLTASLDKFKVAPADRDELIKIVASTRGDIVEKK